MSKRPSSSRPAKRPSKPVVRRNGGAEATAGDPPAHVRPSRRPSMRERILLAIVAGALAAWLALLAIVAFAM